MGGHGSDSTFYFDNSETVGIATETHNKNARHQGQHVLGTVRRSGKPTALACRPGHLYLAKRETMVSTHNARRKRSDEIGSGDARKFA